MFLDATIADTPVQEAEPIADTPALEAEPIADTPVQDPELGDSLSSYTYPPPPSNQPPVISAGSSSTTVNEGSYASMSGTFSDPNYDMVTLSASMGTVNPPMGSGGTWSWSHFASDGPFSSSVTITANDGRGGVATTNFSFSVNNVAPTLGLSGPSEVDAGDPVQIGRSYSDPGADTVSSWNVSWGDNTPAETIVGNPSSFSHTYATEGSFTISATATDEDGTFAAPSQTVAAKMKKLEVDPGTVTVAKGADGHVIVKGKRGDIQRHAPDIKLSFVDEDGDTTLDPAGITLGREAATGDQYRTWKVTVDVALSARAGTYTVKVEKGENNSQTWEETSFDIVVP